MQGLTGPFRKGKQIVKRYQSASQSEVLAGDKPDKTKLLIGDEALAVHEVRVLQITSSLWDRIIKPIYGSECDSKFGEDTHRS